MKAFLLAALFLLFAPHAHAAISLVAHTAQVNNNISPAINTTGANFIIVGCHYYNTMTAAISDSMNNTWHALTTHGHDSDAGFVQFFYAYNATTSSSQTFTCTAQTYEGITVSAYSGIQSSSDPFDAQNGVSTTTASYVIQTGSITPAATGELLIAGYSDGYSTNATATISDGFTITDSPHDGSNMSGAMAYLIATTTNAYNPTWYVQSSTLAVRAAGIAAFKAASNPPVITSFSASPTLVASAGTSTLSWNISNASSVSITATGYGGLSTSTQVGSTTVNPTASTTYLLTATASDSSTSTATTSVSVDNTAPSSPSNLTLSSVSTSTLTLTWSSSTDTGGSSLSFYSIFRCAGSSCTPGTLLATTTTSTAPTYSDTGLTPSTTYVYALTATDGVGNQSATSTSVTTSTLSSSTPSIGSFSFSPTSIALGSSSVLTWTITGLLTSSTITGSTGAGSNLPLNATTSSNGSLTVTPTATGTLTYTILSQNINGTSSATTSLTVATTSTAPQSVAATAGDAAATITFSAPASTGGSSILYYTAYSTPGSLSATSTASPITISGLTNNTSYTFTVTATNIAGESASSSASTSVTPTAATPTSTTSLTVMVPAGYNVGLPPRYGTSATSSPTGQTQDTSSTFAPTSTASYLALLQTLLTKLLVLKTQLAQIQGSGNQVVTPVSISSFTRDLQLWDTGSDVTQLQQFLIQQNSGPAAQQLKTHGVTQTFGYLTYHALKEYQETKGINPTGYFGQITKGRIGK